MIVVKARSGQHGQVSMQKRPRAEHTELLGSFPSSAASTCCQIVRCAAGCLQLQCVTDELQVEGITLVVVTHMSRARSVSGCGRESESGRGSESAGGAGLGYQQGRSARCRAGQEAYQSHISENSDIAF
jgi:hypothetical protein